MNQKYFLNSRVIDELFERVRLKRPLVHNITNDVVTNWTANCLLSLGASPIMAYAEEEMKELVKGAHSLVINLGTPSREQLHSIEIALKQSRASKKPVVIDPAGSGASHFRTNSAQRLVRNYHPTVIRGNASEIISLIEGGQRGKGVDSSDSCESALEAATQLSAKFNCVVCISGEVDYIVDSNCIIKIGNGHSIMAHVTGMGCASTALIGAFLGVSDQPLTATVAAVAVTGIAGEIAAKQAQGPGSFQVLYLDALYNMSSEIIIKNSKILQ